MRKFNLASSLLKSIYGSNKTSTKDRKAPKPGILKTIVQGFKTAISRKKKEEDYVDIYDLFPPNPGPQSPELAANLNDALTAKIAEKGLSAEKVFTNEDTLKSILKEIVKAQPELAGEADELFRETVYKLNDAREQAELVVQRLEEEFWESPNRMKDRNGNVYSTAGDSDLTADIYVEAVYRRFIGEAKQLGLSELDFKRALDDILAEEPHTLYKGKLSRNGKISRNKKLKSPRAIAEMAYKRAQKNTGRKIYDE